MKILQITRNTFFSILLLVGLLFFSFSFYDINPIYTLNIFGFIFILLVPGFLSLHFLNLKEIPFWAKLTACVGVSVIEIISVSLLGNVVLPTIGIEQPLTKIILLVEVFLLIFIQAFLLWHRFETITLNVRKYVFFDKKKDFFLAFIPTLFVLISIFGAIRLNNGASGFLTLVMLIGMAIYAFVLTKSAKNLDANVIPTAFFLMSLSLLLMTSLRGTSVTGHDIQKEFWVFQITKDAGFWSIGVLRDAYSACLSITILPTVLSNLLQIQDSYVYKIYFQIIFALVPGLVFLTTRRYLSSTLAFISTFYFISFPIFFSDMPFLNRQEIAFLFLSLMIYTIFHEQVHIYIRRALFIFFGFGMVVSHYSTTYTVVGMLIFLVVAEPILRILERYLKSKKILQNSIISEFSIEKKSKNKIITFWMVLVLASASFLWSSVLTNTASNSIYRVITATISIMKSNVKEDAQSSDVTYSLLSWKPVDKAKLLKDYEQKIRDQKILTQDRISYVDPYVGTFSEKLAKDDIVEQTILGRFIGSLGVNVTATNSIIRQLSAKFLQILIIAGFIVVLLSRRFFEKKLEPQYILLSGGGLVLMVSMVVLPVLSVEYGVLRAFQQSLIFLGLFIVAGSIALGYKLSVRRQTYMAMFFSIFFFLSSTGVFTQSFGGHEPQLHLNNSGLYYNIYYTHASEISGMKWVNSMIKQDKIYGMEPRLQTDRFLNYKLMAQTGMVSTGDIYPDLIQKNAYVYLGFTNTQKETTTISHNGTLITYSYPSIFLNNSKNLIYSNGDVRIYR